MDMFTVFKEIDNLIMENKRQMGLGSDVANAVLVELKNRLELKEAQYLQAMADEYDRFEHEHI